MNIKHILLLPVLTLAAQAVAQSALDINLHDKGIDSLVLSVSDETFSSPVREVRLAAKDAKVKYMLDEPTVRLVIITTPDADAKKQVKCFAVPGATVRVNGTWDKHTFKGHQLVEDDAAFDAAIAPVLKKNESLMTLLGSMQEAGEPEDSIFAVYRREGIKIRQDLQGQAYAFLKKHPDRDFSAYLAVSQFVQDPDEELAKLAPAVREGIMKPHVEAVFAARKAAAEEQERRAREEQARIDSMKGTPAPDFTLNDLNGQPLSLSSLQGKVVVLDFWGAWCYWCMKGVPDMKKYYDKYSDRMEILGVDCNDPEDKWKQTVKEQEMNWKHVYNPKGNRDVLQKYSVSGFPTKVIISADGKILKTVVGEDPAFYEYLDQLFQN